MWKTGQIITYSSCNSFLPFFWTFLCSKTFLIPTLQPAQQSKIRLLRFQSTFHFRLFENSLCTQVVVQPHLISKNLHIAAFPLNRKSNTKDLPGSRTISHFCSDIHTEKTCYPFWFYTIYKRNILPARSPQLFRRFPIKKEVFHINKKAELN